MTAGSMPRVLFVADEANVLSGLRLELYDEFEVATAQSSAAGLAVVREQDPFMIVVSDLQLPDADGVDFLAQVRELHPNTVCILSTKQAELKAAVSALNEGQIFRLLLKPYTAETLHKTLADAVSQYRSAAADRDRLQCVTVAPEVGDELQHISQRLDRLLAVAPTPKGKSSAANQRWVQQLQQVNDRLKLQMRRLLQTESAAVTVDDTNDTLDLCEIAGEVLMRLRASQRSRGVQLKLDLPAEPALVNADRTPIEQVVVNLVDNAVDAVLDEQIERSRTVSVGIALSPKHGTVRCRIVDSGCGMGSDELQTVFDPGDSDEDSEPTGFGLVLVKQIVESYGGTISATSEPGVGSCFTFVLPTASQHEAPLADQDDDSIPRRQAATVPTVETVLGIPHRPPRASEPQELAAKATPSQPSSGGSQRPAEDELHEAPTPVSFPPAGNKES